MASDAEQSVNSLVEKLRQELEFSSFYRTQIQQVMQEINGCCDQVFQTLWLSQCLAHLLNKTRLHQLLCVEWSIALEQTGFVKFVDAPKSLRSTALIESYKRLLGTLLERPAVLARVVVWAESEGRDSAYLVGDLISVVYGHCVFQSDHALFLQLLHHLLCPLVSSAVSPREVFSGVESVFCRALTEYCAQLPDLHTFMAEALQEPLAEVLVVEEHLEFDVSKAGNRIQSSAETFGTGWLLDGSAFLFGEDLDLSCENLARLAAQFVDGISRNSAHFPPSLKWILATLKKLICSKWPEMSLAELRRPVSSLLFGPILGSGIVNPDSHGVCGTEVVVGPVARYNLSQVATVLQGCAWVMERQGGKFPLQKVIKKMDTDAYCSLLDTLDGGCGEETPELPSSLPGLKRTAYLASQTQLNDLVGIVCEAAKHLTRSTGQSSSPTQEELTHLTRQLPQPVKQMATLSAYSLPNLPPSSSRTPTKSHPHRSSVPLDPGTPAGAGGGGKVRGDSKKRASADIGRFAGKSAKKRSSSTSNLNQILVGGGGGGEGYSTTTRASARSISPNRMMLTQFTSSSLVPVRGGQGRGPSVPSEVLIFPVSKNSGRSSRGRHRGRWCASGEWEFAILSQDEFMQQQPNSTSASPAHHKTDSAQCTSTAADSAQDTPTADCTDHSHPTSSTHHTTDSAQDTPTADCTDHSHPTSSTHHTTDSAQDTPNADCTDQSQPTSSTHHTTDSAQNTPTPQPISLDSHSIKSASSSEHIPQSSIPIPDRPCSIPDVPISSYPSPIPESPTPYQNGMENVPTTHQNGTETVPTTHQNGTETDTMSHQNGMGSGSNSTNSVRSPIREQWERRMRGSQSGTGMRHAHSTGSDSSLSTCMSSREPSSSPQSVPKKRSFTVTSIDNGKFQLNFDLQSSLGRLVSPPPLLSPTSPVPIITTTPTPLTPPFITSPLANGLIYPLPSKSPLSPTLSGTHIFNGTESPIEAHLSPSPRGDAYSATPVAPPDLELSPSIFDLSTSDHDRGSSGCNTPNTIGSSAENLLEGVAQTEGGAAGKKLKKKKRWRLRRNKEKVKGVKQQRSVQEDQVWRPTEEEEETELAKKQRSKSHDLDATLVSRETTGSRGSTMRGGRTSEVGSLRTTFKKRRSNTIIDKYRAIVDEQKKKQLAQVVSEKLDSLPRFVDVRVGDMGSEEFRVSLYCTQLEYKLRAALQNVHAPLVPGVRGDHQTRVDLKQQLTSVLESTLQRSRWNHNNMDTALLLETLKMVAQLPNPLVGVVLTMAHEEHRRRKAYSDYLVRSHMKFLDVRLQVGAAQTAVDRQQEVLREQFVQLAVRQFLESQAGQLSDLHQTLTSLPLADERCSLMASRVDSFTESLLEDHTWRYWPREGMQMVTDYLEDQLFSLLYPHVFQPNSEVDRQKDEVYSAHLARLSEGLTPAHRSLQISPIYHSGCPWLAAQKHLKAMSLFKSPRGKVHCIAESCRVLISLLQFAKVGSPPGADDLFPVLVYILIKANPPGLLSTTQYIKNFLEDNLVGEENYWWVQFSTAVEFTKTLE